MKKFLSVLLVVPAVPAVTVVTTAKLKLLFADEKISVSINVGAHGARGDRGDYCTIEASFC